MPHSELRLNVPNIMLSRLFRLFLSFFNEIMGIEIRTTYRQMTE
jgi:hypothetical protein